MWITCAENHIKHDIVQYSLTPQGNSPLEVKDRHGYTADGVHALADTRLDRRRGQFFLVVSVFVRLLEKNEANHCFSRHIDERYEVQPAHTMAGWHTHTHARTHTHTYTYMYAPATESKKKRKGDLHQATMEAKPAL